MRKSTALILTVLAALVAVAVPLLLVVWSAGDEALELERERSLMYAQELLAHAETTADQLQQGIASLERAGFPPCSGPNLALMRRIDLASTNIQAMAYVTGNHVACSSLGDALANVDLGPASAAHPDGVKIRDSVLLPFAPNNRFIVVERSGYAAVVHKDVVFIGTLGSGPSAQALVAVPERLVLTARGQVDPRWIGSTAAGARYASVHGDFLVGVVVSRRYHLMGLSVIPVAQLAAHTRAIAEKMVPVALVSGVLLSLVVFYMASRLAELPSILKGALRRDEFFLEYFPVVELATGRVVGAEALIRWRRKRGLIVAPDDFIPAAERSGIITHITKRVMELVARDAGTLFQRYPHLHIGINLAPEDLHDPVTVGRLQRLAERTRAIPGNLVVEATERGFTDPALARKVIHQLHLNGIAIAIDDFGTGYSSLSVLESMDLDYLKIDQAFVRTLGTEAATGTVVLHIIEMAKALRLEMVAEGVCTEAQAAVLRERGVQFAQGWLFGRPMPLSALVDMLERQAGAVGAVRAAGANA